MSRNEIIRAFLESDLMKKWHWFSYHFQFYLSGREHYFAKSIVDAIFNIDGVAHDFAPLMIERLASISGKEHFQPHYEQLMQLCAELYVFNRVVSYFHDEDVAIVHEPTSLLSAKNPEFVVKYGDVSFGVEVKSPSLLNHMNHRYGNPAQISTRIPGFLQIVKNNFDGDAITYPRDNPIKDFLLSADAKFAGFKDENKKIISLLFILWDDAVYEPISALLGQPSGLFLENSFAKDKNGNVIRFKNIDAVIVDGHLSNIMNAAGDRPLLDTKKHAMDYGARDEPPYKVVIPCPDSHIKLPEAIVDCFQLQNLSPKLGAEYIPSDFIMWLNENDE